MEPNRFFLLDSSRQQGDEFGKIGGEIVARGARLNLVEERERRRRDAFDVLEKEIQGVAQHRIVFGGFRERRIELLVLALEMRQKPCFRCHQGFAPSLGIDTEIAGFAQYLADIDMFRFQRLH